MKCSLSSAFQGELHYIVVHSAFVSCVEGVKGRGFEEVDVTVCCFIISVLSLKDY